MNIEALKDLTRAQQELSQVYTCLAANELHIARLHQEIADATQRWQESQVKEEKEAEV